jgi:hypothetical protein
MLSEIGEIIDCVRKGIKYLVVLGGRMRQFSEITIAIALKNKKKKSDVSTRWNY